MNTTYEMPLFDAQVFHGPDVTPVDAVRLESYQAKIEALMSDGKSRTLAKIAMFAGCSEATASARLRQMRGRGWTVERTRDEYQRGIFHYRAFKD